MEERQREKEKKKRREKERKKARMKEGRKEGIKEGRKEGRNEGRKEGRKIDTLKCVSFREAAGNKNHKLCSKTLLISTFFCAQNT